MVEGGATAEERSREFYTRKRVAAPQTKIREEGWQRQADGRASTSSHGKPVGMSPKALVALSSRTVQLSLPLNGCRTGNQILCLVWAPCWAWVLSRYFFSSPSSL